MQLVGQAEMLVDHLAHSDVVVANRDLFHVVKLLQDVFGLLVVATANQEHVGVRFVGIEHRLGQKLGIAVELLSILGQTDVFIKQ